MTYFSPGPSQLYFTVQDHLKTALRDGIPSLSHRSKTFESIYREVSDNLRELLNIAKGYQVVFTSSATEIFERSIQNLVEQKSFHLVNGSFSKRFYEIALQLERKSEKLEVQPGHGFQKVNVPAGTELIGITHNETSTGVSLSPDFVHSFKKQNPEALICVDAVSSLPYPEFNFNEVDSVFFSIQKGFGLPPGLGVWIVNERCLAKAQKLASRGINIGTYHSLVSLWSNAQKNQTPETPNVLFIYLLAKVTGDFLRKGMHKIRKETEYKSAVLYKVLDEHSAIKPFVQNPADRSKTVIVAQTGDRTVELYSYLLSKGLMAGEGHSEFKKQHLRFANFPAHSKEQFEALADALVAFH